MGGVPFREDSFRANLEFASRFRPLARRFEDLGGIVKDKPLDTGRYCGRNGMSHRERPHFIADMTTSPDWRCDNLTPVRNIADWNRPSHADSCRRTSDSGAVEFLENWGLATVPGQRVPSHSGPRHGISIPPRRIRTRSMKNFLRPPNR